MKRLLKWLLGIVISVAILFGGVYLFAKIKYDVNLITLYKQVNILNENVDESTMYPNRIVYNEDMASAKDMINAKLPGLVSYDAEADKYTIGETATYDVGLTNLNLTDRQSGAILETLLKSNEANASVTISGKKIDMQLIQVSFVSLDPETKTVTINIVVKLDLSQVKADFKSFPLSIIAKKVPNSLYISSTVDVKKDDGEFAYTITSNNLTINKLDAKQTTEFVKALNVLTKIGTSDDLNLTIGEAFVNGLIGYDNSHKGFAYALKTVGVKDYTFELIDEKVYFVLIPKILV